MEITYNISIYKSGNKYIACNLEYMLTAQGDTREEAICQLRHMITTHIYSEYKSLGKSPEKPMEYLTKKTITISIEIPK